MAKKPHVPETSLSVSIKLGIRERILFRGLMPQQSGYLEQLLAHGILKKVEISKQEIKEFGIKDIPGGRIEWDEDNAKEKPFKFNEVEYSFLKDQVDRLDKEKKISIDLFGVCKKIKEAKDGEKKDAVDT